MVALAGAGSESALRWLDAGRRIPAGGGALGSVRGQFLFGVSTPDARFGVIGRELGGDPFSTNSIEIRSVDAPEAAVVRFTLKGASGPTTCPGWPQVGRRIIPAGRHPDLRTYPALFRGGSCIPATLDGRCPGLQSGLRTTRGGSDGSVRIWTAGSDHPEPMLSGHGSPVSALAWSPPGRFW